MMIRYFRNQTFIHIIQLAVSNTFFFYSGVIFYKLLPTTSPQNIPHPVTTQHMQMQLSGTHDDVIDSLAQVCSKYQRTPRCPSLTLITLHQASFRLQLHNPLHHFALWLMVFNTDDNDQQERRVRARAPKKPPRPTDRRVPATPSRTNSKHDLAEPKQRCRRFGSRKRAHTHTQLNATQERRGKTCEKGKARLLRVVATDSVVWEGMVTTTNSIKSKARVASSEGARNGE